MKPWQNRVFWTYIVCCTLLTCAFSMILVAGCSGEPERQKVGHGGMMVDDLVDTGNIVDNAITAAKLSAALQDLVPNIALNGSDNTDGTGGMTLQVRDANNNNIAQRFLVRIWIADAEYSEPDAQTDFSVASGEELRELEANADYELITTSSGAAIMDINVTIAPDATKTVYVMAELDGRIYTGSVEITNPS